MTFCKTDIDAYIEYINKTINVPAVHDDSLGEFTVKGDETYFNIELNEKVGESRDFTTLEAYVKQYKCFDRVEQNGLRRVAIFINKQGE